MPQLVDMSRFAAGLQVAVIDELNENVSHWEARSHEVEKDMKAVTEEIFNKNQRIADLERKIKALVCFISLSCSLSSCFYASVVLSLCICSVVSMHP